MFPNIQQLQLELLKVQRQELELKLKMAENPNEQKTMQPGSQLPQPTMAMVLQRDYPMLPQHQMQHVSSTVWMTNHQTQKVSVPENQAPQGAKQSKKPGWREKIQCRYGDKCGRKGCDYFHQSKHFSNRYVSLKC